MTRSKIYTIPLEPIAWKRAGINGKHFYDRQTHEKLAAGLYLRREHGNDPLFINPLKMDISFFMNYPKGHKSKHRAGQWHSKRPDIDNLTKFILDMATGILWTDDCIVSWIEMKKLYDNEPRIVFIITELV